MFGIPDLVGGGLVLGYRCPSRCRHCLYGCGPHRDDGAPEDLDGLDAVLDTLQRRAPYARFHIGGGEPFLDVERLGHAVEGMEQRGLLLDYVETNAAWVKDAAFAEQQLCALKERGLDCVLVSVSPFHAEFIPFAKTLVLIEQAQQILRNGAFVWIADFIDELRRVAGSGRLDFDSWIAAAGDSYAREVAARYSLVLAGRAGRYVAAHGVRLPWQSVSRKAPCRGRLLDTSHFHVDGRGMYVPGLCAGLQLPLSEVPGPIDGAAYPLLQLLLDKGPRALVEMALPMGFTPASGYSGCCDLCTHVRSFLFAQGEFSELGPAGFYHDASLRSGGFGF